MKLSGSVLIIAGLCLALSVSAFAQDKPAPEANLNPNYDAELAKRLGGDDMGMKSYVVAILKTGPNDATITDKAKRDELFKGHFGMINRLAKEGKLVMAGPFNDDKRIYRGLYVFNVATIEEATKLTETDPSIKAGIFQPEFIKWYGSAGLMMMNEIYEKISKTKP
jgi:uncharacterized protein YciI